MHTTSSSMMVKPRLTSDRVTGRTRTARFPGCSAPDAAPLPHSPLWNCEDRMPNRLSFSVLTFSLTDLPVNRPVANMNRKPCPNSVRTIAVRSGVRNIIYTARAQCVNVWLTACGQIVTTSSLCPSSGNHQAFASSKSQPASIGVLVCRAALPVLVLARPPVDKWELQDARQVLHLPDRPRASYTWAWKRPTRLCPVALYRLYGEPGQESPVPGSHDISKDT